MHTPFGKRYFSGGLMVVAGVAALGGSLLSAQASFANPPASGIACNASDGKINGRGSTYQNTAQATFLAGFASDVCGATPGSPADQAGNNMGIYNYSGAVSNSLTGSGNGIIAANCRTDAYAGTDSPYTQAQLIGLNGTPGNATVGGCTSLTGLAQPFAPNTAPFPNAADQTAPIMSFPIAGSSVAIAINLTATDCGGTKPSGLKFTPAQMTYIWGGNATNWNDSALTAGNPTLANCAVPVKRVVRFDTSGTSSIFKNYLAAVDPNRAAATCAVGTTWTSLTGSNTNWPNGAGCSQPTQNSGASGGPSLIAFLATVDGGVGYADLADEVVGVSNSGFITPTIQNAVATGFAAPGAGHAANCDFSPLGLPGSGSGGDAVGLNTSDDWASNNAVANAPAANHVNDTDLGAKYPICGITFDLVYTNLGLGAGASPNAISQLSADQRRTLYSYVTYMLSSTAQGKLSTISYAPLPSLWVPALQAGFQANF